MPPKKVKKSQSSIDKDDFLESVESGVGDIVQDLKLKLMTLKFQEIEKLREQISSLFPAEILSMNYSDYLASTHLHSSTRSENKAEENGVLKSVAEEIVERHEDYNPHTEESAPLTNTEENDRLELCTPLGHTLSLSKIIYTHVDESSGNVLRERKADEEVVLSIKGSPIALPAFDPNLEEMRRVLYTDIAEQSPDTRKVSAVLQKHLQKKKARGQFVEVKQEPGSAV